MIRALSRLGQLVILNFLTIVCSLPVITLGAAITACYDSILRNEDPTTTVTGKEFFRSFFRNFRQATLTWLCILLLFLVAGVDLYYGVAVSSQANIFYLLLGFFLFFLGGSSALWVFPLIARYENTLPAQWKNAFLLAMGHLPRTLCLWCTWLFPLFLTLFWNEFAIYLGWMWFLLGISGIPFLGKRIYLQGLGLETEDEE